MARTNVPLSNLVANGGLAEPAGTAVDPANGHVIDVSGLTGQLIIEINNTFAGTKVVTVKAGAVNPPAFRAGLGDITFTVPASSRAFLGPFEGARVFNAGGVQVDMAAGITGTIAALFIPDTI